MVCIVHDCVIHVDVLCVLFVLSHRTVLGLMEVEHGVYCT